LWSEVRPLLKFHVLLVKSAVDCYRSWKEGLGTHARYHETVCRWVGAIQNGWEETDDACCSGALTLVTDEHHMEQVKSVLGTYVHYFMHGICHRSWNLSSKCLLYSHQHLGEMKIFHKVDFTYAEQ